MIPPRTPQVVACTKCTWRDKRLIRSEVVPFADECPECGSKTTLCPASVSDRMRDAFRRLSE